MGPRTSSSCSFFFVLVVKIFIVRIEITIYLVFLLKTKGVVLANTTHVLPLSARTWKDEYFAGTQTVCI